MLGLLTALISGLLSIVGALIGVFGSRLLDKKNTDQYRKLVVTQTKTLHKSLISLESRCKFEYAALALVENGRIRDFSTAKLISIIDEHSSPLLSSSLLDFQRFKISDDFKNVLKAHIDKPLVTLKNEDLSNSILAGINSAANVISTTLVPIYETEKRLWLLVLRSTSNDLLDQQTKSWIEIEKFKIQKMLEETPEIAT